MQTTFRNLTIIGTSHVARQCVDDVRRLIDELQPAVVAVELDRGRLRSHLRGRAGRGINPRVASRVGLRGYLFARLWNGLARRLGREAGLPHGSELVQAATCAAEHGILVALIDRETIVTVQRVARSLSWRDFACFVGDFSRDYALHSGDGGASRNAPEREPVAAMVARLRARYPRLHRALIAERDEIMGQRLSSLMRAHEGKMILAVVGAAHVDGVLACVLSADAATVLRGRDAGNVFTPPLAYWTGQRFL